MPDPRKLENKIKDHTTQGKKGQDKTREGWILMDFGTEVVGGNTARTRPGKVLKKA